MAEAIVNLVLRNRADAVVKEAHFLYGVHDMVERIERELTRIQSFLKDADAKHHKNERVKKWVSEVQEVGYCIEDALDKFLLKAGEGRPEGLRGTVKSIGKMPIKLIARHKFVREIDEI